MSKKTLPVKLIFNPDAGRAEESPKQLLEILSEMRKNAIVAEVHMPSTTQGIKAVVRRALADGTKSVVVAGGDGTIDPVAAAMVGHPLMLGIIPVGTRNNLALNLGIPSDIPGAVELLRKGKALKIDLGKVTTNRSDRHFLELVTLGLLSDMYFVTDDIQHGDLSKVGEFISTLVASTPFTAKISLDTGRKIKATAFVILIANMPYIGANMQIDPSVSYQDGKLDVFVFTELSKINLVSYALRSLAGNTQDESIKHYRAKQVSIDTTPRVAIIADGFKLTEGKLGVKIKPRALKVIAGRNKAQSK
jgi:diacylglycerol kinase (ATP)